MKTRFLTMLLAMVFVALGEISAHAARNFVLAAQTPAAPATVAMGSTGVLTFQITNSNTGGNTGERIYEVRFRMSGGRSTFSSATAAPAGWTRTAYSTTSVTFRATSWANAIATGSFTDFPIIFSFRSTTADTNENLRDIRARFTTSVGGPPFTNLGTDTDNNQGSWTLKSLSITSFQTTDLSGTPISAVTSGTSFRLVMTIRNNSTATQTAIISSPNPPTPLKVGIVTQALTSTVYNPNPLNLAAGASGTITFTYSTDPADSGTIQFSAFARNGANTATSSTALSNVLAVSRLTASIAQTPPCFFSGSTAMFTMTVTNDFGIPVLNVTPSALTRVTADSAVIGAFTGPAPASIASLASGASGTFTWTAPVTGTVPAAGPKPSFSVTGFATANGGLQTPVATSNTEDVDDFLISVTPTNTNALSTNQELTWTVTNRWCVEVDSLGVAIPAAPPGWSWGGDGYSLVERSGPALVETWGMSVTPPALFTAPAPADQLILDGEGQYSLTFSATPTGAGPSQFDLTITDKNGLPTLRSINVTVDPYNANGLNTTNTSTWQEQFR